MGKIKVLPKSLANQIAAGEVIERPASVVKELVENSLDAGATRIQVWLEEGGKKKIRVVDNGEGMDPEDARRAFLRHATSKVRQSQDLYQIRTLGFRGEALSSIASVSKVRMRTCPVGPHPANPVGFELSLTAGKVVGQQLVGMPVGTDIEVSELFFNLPARKKFLKSTRTEIRHIRTIISHLAMAYPQVGFELYHNQRELIVLPEQKSARLAQRIRLLLGEDFLTQMYPLSLDSAYLKISGWVNQPGYAASSAREAYLFVNRRRVENRTVYSAVKTALAGLLGRGECPRYILFLQIAPDLVDVNVHPRKEEVRFINQSSVFNLVRQSVGAALQKQNFRREVSGFARSESALVSEGSLKDRAFKPRIAKPSPSRPIQSHFGTESLAESLLPEAWVNRIGTLEQGQPVLQVARLYLVRPDLSSKGGIAIYDQHAAHERVLYEKFVRSFKDAQNSAESQTLLMPITIALAASDFELLMENRVILEKIGFRIKGSGENTVKISAVPVVLKDKHLDALIREFIAGYADLPEADDFSNPPTSLDGQTHQALACLACRSAVKAGDVLTAEQARRLIDQVERLEHVTTSTPLRGVSVCPHGRPIRIVLSLKEIAKMFRRR